MFWVGPILGGVCGAFCFQFIFNVQRPRSSIKDMEANMSMVNNSEEDMIDDLERVKQYRSNMMQVIKYKDQITSHQIQIYSHKHGWNSAVQA